MTEHLSLAEIQNKLKKQHYAVVSDKSLGFGPEFREHLLRYYFNTDIVRTHEGDIPQDRERARDLVRVAFLPQPGIYVAGDNAIAPISSGIYLSRHPHTDVGVRRKSNISYRPEYSRIESLEDPHLIRFLAALHNTLPPNDMPTATTMGINFFRTHTDVVAKPHQDEENYVFVYVVDKVGQGARTRLYRKLHRGEAFRKHPEISVTLDPGMMIIFKDEMFLHHTSKLSPLANGEARRDVIVCTSNYASTHPW